MQTKFQRFKDRLERSTQSNGIDHKSRSHSRAPSSRELQHLDVRKQSAVNDLKRQKQLPAPPSGGQGTKNPQESGPSLRRNEMSLTADYTRGEHGDPRGVISGLRQDIAALQRNVKVLKEQHAHELDVQKGAYEAEIQQLQNHAFQTANASQFQPDDDTTVANRLVSIRDRITAFAKLYALDSLQHLVSGPGNLLAQLREALNSSDVAAISSDSVLLEIATTPHGARLFLTALLSFAVHNMAFANPFFFMSDLLQDEFDTLPSVYNGLCDRLDASDGLKDMFELVAESDQQLAHVWRSDTLRALRTNRQDLLTRRCRHEVDAFENGAAALLVRSVQTEPDGGFKGSLFSIFVDAGELAMQLWSQRPGIVFRSMQELAQERFAVTSDIMQAHPLHKLDDPDDSRLDGRRMVLVVHPAVLRTGTHDAENYDHEVIWAKAVVWLGTSV